MEEGRVEETEVALTRHKTPKGVGGFVQTFPVFGRPRALLHDFAC